MKRNFWYKYDRPHKDKVVSFSGDMPSFEKIREKVSENIGAEVLLKNIDYDRRYPATELCCSKLAKHPDNYTITIVADYKINELSVFYGIDQRYFPNALVSALEDLGGKCENKPPKWTSLKWRDVRWWHYATDSLFITWRIQVLISYFIVLPVWGIMLIVYDFFKKIVSEVKK